MAKLPQYASGNAWSYTWSVYLLQKTLRCSSSEKMTAKASMAMVMNVAVMPSATHRPRERL